MLMVMLSGCQVIARRTPPPSLTPVLLTTQGTPTAAGRQPGGPASATPTIAASPAATETLPSSQLPAPPTPTAGEAIMALGTQATVTLRAQPAANSGAVAQVPGSQVLWARGRNADSTWLWVTYNEAGRHAWVSAREVKLLGDASALPDITSLPGTGPTATTAAPAPAPATATPVPVAVAPVATPSVSAARATTTPTATRTRAPASALSGKIAFQTAVGGEIYLVNADGTSLRRSTEGFDPALSPDGTQLAFVRWGTPDGLYVLDLRTGEERRLATPRQPRGPAWSPDGARIVLSHNSVQTTCLDTPFGCFSEEDVRNFFAGRDCIDTAQGRFCIADFQPRQIYLTDLALVTVSDGSWLDLASQRRSQTPSWHPKRNEILYTGRTGLQLITVGEVTRPFVNDVTLSSASWAPDGQRIVAQAHKHDHWDIVLLDAAGNILAQLTQPDPLSAQKPNNVAPTWSPDGKMILFLSDRDGSWRPYLMNADGSRQTPFLPQVLGKVNFSYNYAAERVFSWSR
ncbi:MAG: hypothetical protein N2204_09185 [Anaerolineae bacterium]|nr:hypothetical protein [Anaerolineae bacterium]